jgi:hypothetical protein
MKQKNKEVYRIYWRYGKAYFKPLNDNSVCYRGCRYGLLVDTITMQSQEVYY